MFHCCTNEAYTQCRLKWERPLKKRARLHTGMYRIGMWCCVTSQHPPAIKGDCSGGNANPRLCIRHVRVGQLYMRLKMSWDLWSKKNCVHDWICTQSMKGLTAFMIRMSKIWKTYFLPLWGLTTLPFYLKGIVILSTSGPPFSLPS